MFYQFQKIHKPENLWRRLISSVICNTTSTSQYLDKYLQPCVKDLQSYIKDSTDLMKKNNNPEKFLKIVFQSQWVFVHWIQTFRTKKA